MATTKRTDSLERQKALAWIASQLRWERALADLRDGRTDAPARRAA
jgi:hypothetical protein